MAGWANVFWAFLMLGLTSFGGPIAHIGYFRTEFVQRRGWLTEERFAEILALAQFLPGPASSQLGFAIGRERAGLGGAFAAFAGFTLPSMALMIALAVGWQHLPAVWVAPVMQGLKLVAVAVVAQALLGMSASLLKTGLHKQLAILSAVITLTLPWALTGVALIGLTALATALATRPADEPKGEAAPAQPIGKLVQAGIWACMFVGGWVGLGLWAGSGSEMGKLLEAHWRAGALVFGGGHVVLPMLESSLVAPGWLDKDAFLSGYASAQIVPGPMFTLASFTGAAANVGPGGVQGGVAATLAMFAPGLLLMLAGLPLWQAISHSTRARAVMANVSALVVGILGAAFVSPVTLGTITDTGSAALAMLAYFLLSQRVPVLAVAVLVCAIIAIPWPWF